LEDYDWVFYTDIDTFVVNPNIKLESFIKDAPSTTLLAIKNQRCDIISSPLFFRGGKENLERMKVFLSGWRETPTHVVGCPRESDQVALQVYFLQLLTNFTWPTNLAHTIPFTHDYSFGWETLMEFYGSPYKRRNVPGVYFFPTRLADGTGIGGFDGLENIGRPWPVTEYPLKTDLHVHGRKHLTNLYFTIGVDYSHCDTMFERIDTGRLDGHVWCPYEEHTEDVPDAVRCLTSTKLLVEKKDKC